MSEDAVFRQEGETFVPTPLAQGPWVEGALHGGPTAALLAHMCERFDGGQSTPMRLARLTVDLLRPIPAAPLRPAVRVARPGRKAEWLDASLFAGEVEVARASALRLRPAAVDPPAGVDPWVRSAAGGGDLDGRPDDASPYVSDMNAVPGFHDRAVELRFVRSGPTTSGPGQVWVRILHPLVAGADTSPWMRAVASADFGNATSALLPFDTYSFVNADLVVALWRDPQGPWIGVDAVTRFEPATGAGLTEMSLHDGSGPVGRAQQSVLIEPRR